MSKRPQPPSLLATEALKLLNAGQVEPALAAAQKALAIKKNDISALNVMALIESRRGRLAEAIAYLTRVVALQPTSAEAHFNLGCTLQQAGDARAEHHYREAIRLQNNIATYHNNLGSWYFDTRDLVQAEACYARAMALDPAHDKAVKNLYTVYRRQGRIDKLEDLTRAATQRWPDDPEHWLIRSEALFAQGQLEGAWRALDWRFKSRPSPVISRAQPGIPEWQGESLQDKSVLVWTEQGPGDEVMHGTLLPAIAQRVGKLSILCSARMAALFKRTFPDADVYGDVVPEDARKRIDVQAPVLGFAKSLRPDLAAFDANPTLLKPDAARVAELKERYRAGTNKILIGIAWKSANVLFAAEKSVNLGEWGAIFALPGVQFVNLQYGDCQRELAGIKAEFGADVLHDPSIDPLRDLEAHAAQIAAMDIVVSSSNTAAHFAGALGVTTHCMLPATAGFGRRWYWLEREGRSVWYPSMRLWPQAAPGQWLDAVRRIATAVAVDLFARGQKQDAAQFLFRLAESFRGVGQGEGAREIFEAAATLPGCEAAAYSELGNFARRSGQQDVAETYFDRALAANPDFMPALNMKGMALVAREEYAKAEPYYRRALEIAPKAFEVYNNLGTCVRRLGRGLEAQELYSRANALQPNHPGILLNLAITLTEIGQPAEALPYFDQLLTLQPDYAEAHHGRAFALLTQGRLAEGWPELWWRHRVPAAGMDPITLPPSEELLPRWQGQDLAAKSVLVCTEHGLGDEILAVSMLPDLFARTRSVTVRCSARLVPLFQRSFPQIRVLSYKDGASLNLRKFDYQATLPELGAAFRRCVEDFPSRPSFLSPDQAASAHFKNKYRSNGQNFVVGMSWASANRELEILKNLPLEKILRGLLSDAWPQPVQFVNLQYGNHAPEIAAVKQATGIEVLQDPEVDAVQNVDHFSAQVSAMNAVVTISNTTAHVAGALGVPTFLLLPHNRGRHWYWLRGIEHCPWYPSVQYFIQSADGTWDAALAACSRAIAAMK